MPRPPKYRRVEFEPRITYFKPAGIPKCKLQELTLNVEELEAIRLKDKEGLEQEECAERMHVSRPTYQRILMSAREKIADAIIEGKAIRIEGGNYRLATEMIKCAACQYEFEIPLGCGYRQRFVKCPKCDKVIENINFCKQKKEKRVEP